MLWRDGFSPSGIPRPGFIRWCPANYMWAFMVAFPFAFCDKKYWFLPKRDVPFECFDPIGAEKGGWRARWKISSHENFQC